MALKIKIFCWSVYVLGRRFKTIFKYFLVIKTGIFGGIAGELGSASTDTLSACKLNT